MSPPRYSTTDPYLASFLANEGCLLVGCRRLTPKRVEYRFVADRSLHALLRLYWRATPVSLSPCRLFDVLRVLRSRPFIEG